MEERQKLEILYNKYPNYDWTINFEEIPDLDDCSYFIDMVYGSNYPRTKKENLEEEEDLLEIIRGKEHILPIEEIDKPIYDIEDITEAKISLS